MDKLNILWTTDNKDTFINMISMYSINAKTNKWWDEINVIIWGASINLAGHDPFVQKEIKKMKDAGVIIEACQACADNFSVTDKLIKLDINVRYMGEPLTEYLKKDEKLLTI